LFQKAEAVLKKCLPEEQVLWTDKRDAAKRAIPRLGDVDAQLIAKAWAGMPPNIKPALTSEVKDLTALCSDPARTHVHLNN
jgi:hypothetical protein